MIMTDVLEKVSERAVKRVKTGHVISSIVRLSEREAPDMSTEEGALALVGRRIEYVCMINREESSVRRERYTYSGIVQSVQYKKSSKSKHSVSGESSWARGAFATAVVAWEQEGEDPSGVFLIPKLYGSDQKDGWLLVGCPLVA